MNDFTNWRGQGQLEPVKATPDAVSALTKLVSGWMDRRKQSQQGGGPRQRPWHEDALLHAHKAQTDLEKTLAIKDFENKGRADEAMVKAAGEAHLVRVKAEEERKTTSTAVMQENQRLKNFTAMGVNVENIADLTTKNNTADLRIRLRAPEKPEDETSSKDFSEASDKTPRSGAKRRGRKDAFDGGRGVEPTPAAEESAAPATPTPSGGTRNPFVIPGANPIPTIRPTTPTTHTLRPTSTPSVAVTETGQEDTGTSTGTSTGSSDEPKASEYVTGPHETDIEKIKARFKIQTNEFGHKWGTYTDPKSKLKVLLKPNYQRPESRWKDKYGKYWEDTLDNGKPEADFSYDNETKAPEFKLPNGATVSSVDGGGPSSQGRDLVNHEDKFAAGLHAVAMHIARHNSWVNELAAPTKEERESKIAAGEAHEANKIGKPCTFCGETIKNAYDARFSHDTLSNGWCSHALGALKGGGWWNTDEDK
jgi:hypothetical protein